MSYHCDFYKDLDDNCPKDLLEYFKAPRKRKMKIVERDFDKYLPYIKRSFAFDSPYNMKVQLGFLGKFTGRESDDLARTVLTNLGTPAPCVLTGIILSKSPKPDHVAKMYLGKQLKIAENVAAKFSWYLHENNCPTNLLEYLEDDYFQYSPEFQGPFDKYIPILMHMLTDDCPHKMKIKFQSLGRWGSYLSGNEARKKLKSIHKFSAIQLKKEPRETKVGCVEGEFMDVFV